MGGVVDVQELAIADGRAVQQPVVEPGPQVGVRRRVERVVGLRAGRAEVDARTVSAWRSQSVDVDAQVPRFTGVEVGRGGQERLGAGPDSSPG